MAIESIRSIKAQITQHKYPRCFFLVRPGSIGHTIGHSTFCIPDNRTRNRKPVPPQWGQIPVPPQIQVTG